MIGQDSTSNLRRGTLEAFALRSVGVVSLFAMHTVLGRSIGPQGYGTFSYVLALTSVLAVIVPLGWPMALMRFAAQYTEQRSWGLLRGVVARGYQVTLLSSITSSCLLLGVSFWPSLPENLVVGLRFSALLLPLLSFVGLRRRTLQGLRRTKSSIFPEEIFLPLSMLAGTYLFYVNTSSGALFLYAGVALLAFLLGNTLLTRSMSRETRTTKPVFDTRFWMVTALPMVFIGFSQTILGRMDILVLGSVLEDKTIGLYSAASRIAILITFVMTAVNTIGSPMLASAHYGGRPDQFHSIMRWAMLWSTLGALPLLGVMIVFPEFLLGMFGDEFVEGANLLRILALGQFVNAATGLVGSALVMTGREREFAKATGISAAASLVGNLVAVTIWGALGAAIATSASIALYNLWLLLLVSKVATYKASSE